MQIIHDAPLAPYTSFETGGPAKRLVLVDTYDELAEVLASDTPSHVLGYGCNVLIADTGLPGSVVVTRGGSVTRQQGVLVADAGAWWDDVVQQAIAENLWGIELMSAIPGGVGAAVVGNVAAYGQAISDSLAWVEVWQPGTRQLKRLEPNALAFGYRSSGFQSRLSHLVITRAAFHLRPAVTSELSYQSALDIAAEKGHDTITLAGRRQTILDTRARAGSLWDYRGADRAKTAGSFFKNPRVSAAQAEAIIAHDETGRSAELIKKMNSVHGGDSLRVSAAHVLLAAGFQRGQSWGPVRLHPDHVLKLENTGGATSAQLRAVADEIVATVHERLGITLMPEVRYLGEF